MNKYYKNEIIYSNNDTGIIIEERIKHPLKVAIFAGGCFWCIADPFYNVVGVLKVISGYCGGTTDIPKYSEVKSGQTGHKESIMVIYDSTKIAFKDLLKIYFENIDPFDGDGQFIDRGSSYQTAVFTEDIDEINIYSEMKSYIESKYGKKVLVPILKKNIFYFAEEEHQNFSINNVERFKIEEKLSGRDKYQGIKLK